MKRWPKLTLPGFVWAWEVHSKNSIHSVWHWRTVPVLRHIGQAKKYWKNASHVFGLSNTHTHTDWQGMCSSLPNSPWTRYVHLSFTGVALWHFHFIKLCYNWFLYVPYAQTHYTVDYQKKLEQSGVALLIKKINLILWRNLYFSDDRIVTLKLKLKHGYLSICIVYTPKEGIWSEEFCNHLQTVIKKRNKCDQIIITFDLITRVSNLLLDNMVSK